MQITLIVFLISVTPTVPKYPSVRKLTPNIVKAILLKIPLYLIYATLLLSSQGTTKNMATAAAITISPPSGSGIALSIV